jgi:hypothetical protein
MSIFTKFVALARQDNFDQIMFKEVIEFFSANEQKNTLSVQSNLCATTTLR